MNRLILPKAPLFSRLRRARGVRQFKFGSFFLISVYHRGVLYVLGKELGTCGDRTEFGNAMSSLETFGPGVEKKLECPISFHQPPAERHPAS